jgi:uncharacterized protein (TIGR03437 family)
MKIFQTALGPVLAATLGLTLGLTLNPTAANAQQYTISTVAGIGGVQGFYGDTGAATLAELDVPLRVAVDSKGNFYIVDYYTFVIREVTAATGIINTVAGEAGVEGFVGDNGPAIQANLTDVHGIVVDSSGNLYIADTGNSRVRKVDTSGNITTYAGGAGVGYGGDGGKAIAATLNRPAGLAVDSNGNLYIADYGNATVRKVTPAGIISTVVGNGTYGNTGDGGAASSALMGDPYAIALDPAGNIFISDLGYSNIRKISTSGTITTVATGVAVESLGVDASGNIYYPDYGAQTIQKLLPSGAQLTIAGNGTAGFSGDGGAATSAQLNQPYGVALTSSGAIYVADSQNQAIRLLTPVSTSVGVVNAASNIGGAISPGEIVAIYANGIGPSALTGNTPAGGFFGSQVGGTTVSFDGHPAPLIYTSAGQVAAIVPYEEVQGTTANVSVSYQGQTLTTTIPVVATIPGIFTVGSLGSGPAAAVNQNQTLNTATNPALAGSYISLYLTGEGQTTPAGVDGKIQAGATLPQPLLQVSATVGGADNPAIVSYAGAAPQSVAGLMQVNLQIPLLPLQSGAPAVSVPVVVMVNGVPTQTAVSIYVAAP